MIKNKILLLLIATLAGCGGGDSSSPTSTNKQVEEEGVDNTPSSILQAQDSYAVVKPYQEESVSLAEYIPSNAKIINVINESGDPLCDVTELADTSFNVKINALMPCRYSYQVKTDATAASNYAEVLTSKAPLRSAANGARIAESDYQAAITVLTSTSDNSLLPPIAIATTSNVTSSIDLKAHLQSYYPNGYVLQDGPILAGNGEIISIDKTQQSITFKAGAEGMSRITYTLKGTNAEGEEDLNLGVIDIATSDTANQPPIANSFTFGYEPMVNSAAVEIDVSEHILSNDGGDLQLVYVSSLNATVKLKEPEALTNKVFTFATSTPGTHMVTYGIFDHRGGYAIGIVEVHVSGLDYSQWNSLFHDGYMFTAPLTALEASAMGVKATSLTDFKERTYTPSIPMATFNYTDAKNYCELVHKGRLPTIEEVHYFFQRTDSSGEADEDKQPHTLKEGHWPISANYYIAYSSDVRPNDTIVRLHRVRDGNNTVYNEAAVGQTSFYVTCVVPLNVTFTATVTDNNAAANDTALIHVDVKAVDSLGRPSKDIISVEVLAPEGVTIETDASQNVSADGNRFSFRSIKAATIPLKFDYNGNIFLSNITFVADRSTAKIVDLTKVRDEQPAGRPYLHNSINLTILDAYNNPIPNMKMVVSGGNSKANFIADNPELATNNIGEIINYDIRINRLSDNEVRETSTVFIETESLSDKVSIPLTNTFPMNRILNVYYINPATLIVAPVTVDELAISADYTELHDNGRVYALMNYADGMRHCEASEYLGYNNWTLTNYDLLRGTALEYNKPSGLGWPNGTYWYYSGAADITQANAYDSDNVTAIPQNAAFMRLISCIRTPEPETTN